MSWKIFAQLVIGVGLIAAVSFYTGDKSTLNLIAVSAVALVVSFLHRLADPPAPSAVNPPPKET